VASRGPRATVKGSVPESIRLGRVGVSFTPFVLLAAEAERAAVQELEGWGYGALWVGEGVGTREAFTHASTLLSWTQDMVVSTGIASIYARDAMAMACAATTLADAFPKRFVLGVGVSHAPSVQERGHVYTTPIETMRAYLDAMAASPYKPADPAQAAPVLLAALAPGMLRVARDRADGVHSFLVPPEHTALARSILGPKAFLAPHQAVLLEADTSEARRLGREHISYYLKFAAYQKNLLRLGFTATDLEGGGSDRLVDALIAWGGRSAVLSRLQAHLDAGANHVCVQAIGPSPLETLQQLAEPLQQL
jgi:probable F420-dependent oxidoreductase